MSPEQVPDALVEKACRARWDALGSEFTGHNGDVARTWDALVALFPTETERRRSNERHALAAVLPLVRDAALKEAADEWQRGAWADAPRRADRVQERIANGQFVGGWLRKRAEAEEGAS